MNRCVDAKSSMNHSPCTIPNIPAMRKGLTDDDVEKLHKLEPGAERNEALLCEGLPPLRPRAQEQTPPFR